MTSTLEAHVQSHRGVERKLWRTRAGLTLEGSGQIEVRTFDISKSGLGFIAPVNPVVRSLCVVHIRIPSPGSAGITRSISAVVVHSIFNGSEDGFRIGAQFRDLDRETILALGLFIDT